MRRKYDPQHYHCRGEQHFCPRRKGASRSVAPQQHACTARTRSAVGRACAARQAAITALRREPPARSDPSRQRDGLRSPLVGTTQAPPLLQGDGKFLFEGSQSNSFLLHLGDSDRPLGAAIPTILRHHAVRELQQLVGVLVRTADLHDTHEEEVAPNPGKTHSEEKEESKLREELNVAEKQHKGSQDGGDHAAEHAHANNIDSILELLRARRLLRVIVRVRQVHDIVHSETS
mmetsp:Transcript_52729/g.122711  ORF Transcript_52729/g.122711 Transcript_52729/m.122711 type:complete len:232 (-) Transcript_52729:3022-3717(-)